MIVAISDTHLGTDHLGPRYVARADVKAFLRYLRDDLKPDHLVLNGDIEDFWRRDMRSLTRESYDVFYRFRELQEAGTAVHYVLGNHDWYARNDIRLGQPSYYLNGYSEALKLTDSGTTYTFMHGHQFDPLQDEWYFDKLALISNDAMGARFSHLWEVFSETRNFSDALRTTKHLLLDRITRGKWEDRIARMDRCQTECGDVDERSTARAYATSKLDTDVICTGHTHIPGITPDGRVANSGAWVGGQNTYLVLEDRPRLMKWNDGDPIEWTGRSADG